MGVSVIFLKITYPFSNSDTIMAELQFDAKEV